MLREILRPAKMRLPIRDMAAAAVILLAASAVLYAQDAMEEWEQDWVPAVLRVPADAELLSDRAIGSTVRMFSIATSSDADALIGEWESALSENGFRIDQQPDELLGRAIEFSGSGVANAKIVATPSTSDGRTVIEFDATLR